MDLTAFVVLVSIFWIVYERALEYMFLLIETISGVDPEKAVKYGMFKKIFPFTFALIVGFFIAFFGDIYILESLYQAGTIAEPGTILTNLDKIIITPLIFAGGPELVNKFTTLADSTNAKRKEESRSIRLQNDALERRINKATNEQEENEN